MAIIEQKKIYDDSKGTFDKLLADFDKLNTEVVTLTKSNVKLAQSLQTVKKTSDGSEAKELVNLTNQLNKSTAKLNTTATEQSRKLTEVKVEQQRLNKVAKEAATLANKNISLYQKESIKLNNLRKEYKELAIQNKQNTAEGKKLLANLTKLDTKLKAVDNAVGQNQRSVGKYGNALRGLGKNLIGSLGVVAGFTALVSIVKDAFKIFVNFEKTNSKLASVLGVTKDEINSLSEQQKELGSTTAFTASQVGELQIELAKLGFSLREIEDSTPGILDLAAATGTDLAQAAELAGSTLRIFNLDASEMQRVTDVLALSTSKSSLSMEKLATILPTVGKTAQIAGVSLEKTAALAGTLTDRGLDASSAATSLRNIFLELSKKGITWNDAMTQINESTDKNKTSMDLFGKRAAAAGVILSETAESTDQLTIALEGAEGAANDMAETMLNNVAGDVTKASSAWEGFILSIADGDGIISKATRSIVQSFTGVLTSLTKFNEVGFVDKAKMMSNGLLSLFGVSSDYGFQVEENTKALVANNVEHGENTRLTKEQREALAKTEEETVKLTAAQIKAIQAQKDLNAARKNREGFADDIPETISGGGVVTSVSDPVADKKSEVDQKLELDQWYLDQKAEQIVIADEVAREDALEREIEFQEAKAELINEFEQLGAQLAIDIFNSIQDEKIAKIQESADTQIKILEDQLDKGVISEEEFTKKKEAIEKRARIKSAEAEKKKAIWEAVIATALAIVKAAPSILKMALAAVIGGIQIAVIAAKPIPQFAEGEVDINAPSHALGGKDVNIEGGESIIKTKATRDSKGLLNMIQDGIVTDKTPFGNYNDMDMRGLIDKFDENTREAKRTNHLLSNLENIYELDGFLHRKTTAGLETKQPLK